MGAVRSVFVGFDPREAAAFAVACHSARRNLTQAIPIRGIVLSDMQSCGLYSRPTRVVIDAGGVKHLVDELSIRKDYDGRMSTQHAVLRFLTPHLAPRGWALFMDGDVLIRGNLARIFDGLDEGKALYCVKHDHQPLGATKMDGQQQSRYLRKNWSSVMIFNVGHPSNRALTVEAINALPGKDLHRFCWLADDEIGELDPKWNWLVGHSDPAIDPAVVHFTEGVPDMPGYEDVPFAEEWREQLSRWAGGFSLAELRKIA